MRIGRQSRDEKKALWSSDETINLLLLNLWNLGFHLKVAISSFASGWAT
jgi:hypothetical protein